MGDCLHTQRIVSVFVHKISKHVRLDGGLALLTVFYTTINPLRMKLPTVIDAVCDQSVSRDESLQRESISSNMRYLFLSVNRRFITLFNATTIHQLKH